MKVADVDPGVSLRRLEAGVAKQRLQLANARAASEHVGSAAMAQQMRRHVLVQPAGRRRFAHQDREPAPVYHPAASAQEEQMAGGRPGKRRASVAKIVLEPGGGFLAERQAAALATFTPGHEDLQAPEVDVAGLELSKLGVADGGGVQDFQDGPVTDAERRGDVGTAQQGLGLAFGEELARHRPGHLGLAQVSGGIDQDRGLAGQVAEERLHRANPAGLGTHPDTLAAVLEREQVLAVGVEVVAGDLVGLRVAALLQKLEQGLELGRVILGGSR